jgi:hypothetical protein
MHRENKAALKDLRARRGYVSKVCGHDGREEKDVAHNPGTLEKARRRETPTKRGLDVVQDPDEHTPRVRCDAQSMYPFYQRFRIK